MTTNQIFCIFCIIFSLLSRRFKCAKVKNLLKENEQFSYLESILGFSKKDKNKCPKMKKPK